MPIPTIWHIPYQRNLFFTGREGVLARLHHALQADSTVALSHPQGISGLGGIGKTQTALEYAYRYQNDYRAVFWVRADSITALTSSFVELAHVLELPERHEQDQDIIVQAVLRWLRLHSGWLLIYDNIDNLSIAEPFLPKTGPGHLLFTTRARSLGNLAERLDIQKMEPEIGALLLLRRASLLALQAVLETANPDDQSIARTISQELDGLPLALDQAGAYVKETSCTLADYRLLYQQRRSNLLQTRGNSDQNYPASVATTWSLSFEKVSQDDPAAADLLDFCAFLAPDAIPEGMIMRGASHLGPKLQSMATDSLLFDQSIATLLAYSLIARNPDAEMLNIHRLVQAVLQDTIPAEKGRQWKQQTVLAINEASPDVQDVTQWGISDQWLPHALACATWIEQEQFHSKESASILNRAGYYLAEHARYGETEPLYVRALAIREQQFGHEHYDTAGSLNNLAGLYESQGKYAKAEPLYLRALSIYEQTLGPEHPNTANGLNNLAALYQSQGKYTQAEPLAVRALAICEQTLGPEHPDTAGSLSNVATLYKSQGKYAQAEPLAVRALAIREQTLGPEHPSTANSLHTLAALYDEQGKYTQAEPLLKRALVICEQVLGPEHPNTVYNLNNLALLYQKHGKYAQAEPLLERALAMNEQQLGPEHPTIALSLNNLALLYYEQGKYAEVEPLYMRSLAICEQQLGPEHPNTASSLSNLASLYDHQGKYAQAEPLLKRALAIREQVLGSEHPSTAHSQGNLADLYERQGKYAEAERLLKRALAICEQKLGSVHPDTATSLNNLALFYHNRRQYAKAEPLYVRALAIREQKLGPEHSSTANSLNNLAGLYKSQGKYAQAVLLLKRALSINENVYAADHPEIAIDLNNLAGIYRSQGKYAEAELLSVRALAIRERQLGETHPDTIQNLNNLALLHQEQGKYAQAELLYQRALAVYKQQEGPRPPLAQTLQENYNTLLLTMGFEKMRRGWKGIFSRFSRNDLSEQKIPSQPAHTNQTSQSHADKNSFDTFTEEVRNVLILAREEARTFQHNYIGTEHLLLGLVRENEGIVTDVLSNFGVELNEVRRRVEMLIGRGDHVVLDEIGITPRAKRAIELAVDEARHLNHHSIGTEHLLLGLVREGEGIAAGVLESLGINLEALRAQTIQVLKNTR